MTKEQQLKDSLNYSLLVITLATGLLLAARLYDEAQLISDLMSDHAKDKKGRKE